VEGVVLEEGGEVAVVLSSDSKNVGKREAPEIISQYAGFFNVSPTGNDSFPGISNHCIRYF